VIALDSIRFLVGPDGQPGAVQVEMPLWQQIVDALEDADDVALSRAALVELAAAGGDPEKAGWLRVDDLAGAWESDDAQ
jgi:hypothetical protein